MLHRLETDTHDPDPDLAIIRLARSRATRRMAIDLLHKRFAKRIYNVALRLVGNADEASDLLQDVFVLLFRKLPLFRPHTTFTAWIYRVTVNLSIDHLRRRRRAPSPTDAVSLLDAACETGDLSHPERALARRDLEGDVRVSLAALTERLRIVVVLRYLEDLSYGEIAEILGCPKGTVKSRLSRAHAILREQLASRYGSGRAA